jgi:hypothetical protein
MKAGDPVYCQKSPLHLHYKLNFTTKYTVFLITKNSVGKVSTASISTVTDIPLNLWPSKSDHLPKQTAHICCNALSNVLPLWWAVKLSKRLG